VEKSLGVRVPSLARQLRRTVPSRNIVRFCWKAESAANKRNIGALSSRVTGCEGTSRGTLNLRRKSSGSSGISSPVKRATIESWRVFLITSQELIAAMIEALATALYRDGGREKLRRFRMEEAKWLSPLSPARLSVFAKAKKRSHPGEPHRVQAGQPEAYPNVFRLLRSGCYYNRY
jgi:hypothetical protein